VLTSSSSPLKEQNDIPIAPLDIYFNMKNISCLSLLGLFLFCVLRPETKTGVLAWVPELKKLQPLARPSQLQHRPRHDVTTIYSAVEETTEAGIATIAEPPQTIAVQMPKIQYTVPGMKLGWKENGVWMDEDGPRNGPPQNFWRQMGDERVYNDNIDLISELVTNGLANNATTRIERLEKTNSIRMPNLNRLILEDWAPILRNGKIIATSGSSSEEKSVEVPYRFRIQRTAGRKLAEPTRYGTFDEHLEAGESITIQELSNDDSVSGSGTLECSSEKRESQVVQGYKNEFDGELSFGNIIYVTKYIMIMRKEPDMQNLDKDGKVINDGAVTEVWMKIDP